MSNQDTTPHLDHFLTECPTVSDRLAAGKAPRSPFIPNYRRATIWRALIAVMDMVSIPITLEQLIIAVQQLQPDEQAQLASTLVQAGLRSDLKALIQELYAQSPGNNITGDDITDDDITAEIKAVRQQSQEA
jgi:hypothetical protein